MSVLVVGAGPAGLVAAKTLLQASAKCSVTVFEAADRVGGMWRFLPGEQGSVCSPRMRTNLSRYTVAFPDLAWTAPEVDLTDPVTGRAAESVPMFPEAWMVGRYLQAYASKFVQAGVVRLNRHVTGAELDDQTGQWTVSSVDAPSQQEHTDVFDHLVVASGFFDTPFNRLDASRHDRVQHSTSFRDVSSFGAKPGKIAVVGGGISGSEAAATAAFQLSSAKYSPAESKPTYAESKVYHVFDRPFYCLPRYLPANPHNPAIQDYNLAPTFLPLDVVLYNLSRRGQGDGEEISAAIGLTPPDKARKGHQFIQSVIGGDQRGFGKTELVYGQDGLQTPAYIGVTDTYMEFVRSGIIVPVLGRAQGIKETNDGHLALDVTLKVPGEDDKSTVTLDNTVGVIQATGFQPSIAYLSSKVKDRLCYDPDCHKVPFLLSRGSIFSPEIPTIAFVGFYPGPYWQVMEVQARLIAQRWSQPSISDTSNDIVLSPDAATQIRQAIKERKPSVPQFWMADYIGLVEEFARKAGVSRVDKEFDESQSGPLFAARYQGPGTNIQDSSIVISEVSSMLQQSTKDARFVAAAVFTAMQGTWHLSRKIDSGHFSMPGGSFKGVAHFHPRAPTDPSYAAEYLYMEQGTFTLSTGYTTPASRRYIYRYNSHTDKISAWFVDADDAETTANLFNTWEFYPPDEGDNEKGWRAQGSHWCDPDTYKSDCEFRFRGAALGTFAIGYVVEGPKKRYRHVSWYERVAPWAPSEGE